MTPTIEITLGSPQLPEISQLEANRLAFLAGVQAEKEQPWNSLSKTYIHNKVILYFYQI
jgi:hypothetical protein